MKRLAILSLIFLAGCTTTDTPQFLEVHDAMQVDTDIVQCRIDTKHYHPRLEWGDFVDDTAMGAGDNIVAAAISPLFIAYGAVSAAATSVLTGLDFLNQARTNATRNCVIEKIHADGSAIPANPNR